ncbi:hypothetical protein NX059_011488 [Plenodomus lindquistii]|nr:hypothetical protein NX059_011488 [Plenodomus lindquistii]
MMRPLVFATCDITPDQYALFLRSAAKVSNIDDSHISYTLVASPTQQHLAETWQLNGTIKSEFLTADWQDLKSAFEALCTPSDIYDFMFLVLYAEAFISETVSIFVKGTTTEFETGAERDNVKYVKWDEYKAPWNMAVDVQFGLEGFIDPPDEWWVREIEREEVVQEEEGEEESEESEDSFDYEYEEGPTGGTF